MLVQTDTAAPTLWHYTCDHGFQKIGREGWLMPSWHPLLGERIVWLTDMATPHREGLGLTSTILTCDRTKHRYRVVPKPSLWIMPMWWPNVRDTMPHEAVATLESAPLAMPAHWWIWRGSVPVVLDETRAA